METARPPQSESISVEIALAVAEHQDTDVLDLPPLYETLDPDALDMLCRPRSDGNIRRVEFEYAGVRIVIDDGDIRVLEDSPA